MPVFVNNDGTPVEIGKGRGDLRYSSMPFSLWDGGAFWDGKPVSFAKVFATQPWVAIAIMRLLTWSIRVPLKVYRQLDEDGKKERLRPGDHPLAAAARTPWERGSMADLVMAMLGPLCVHGNSLLDVEEGASGRLRFESLDWRMVMPITADESDPNAEILGWKVYTGAEFGSQSRSADTVMHLRWWSPLGQLGISPLHQLRSTITAESAAVDWQINNLKQAVRPTGVVELNDAAMGQPHDKRQQLYDDAVASLRSAYGGERNAGKLPVMPPGMKWATATQTTAVEAELIDQRAVNRGEVAAIYMIPPPMIGQLERSTFNNIYTLREMAYTDGLAPPLALIEQAINAHVVQGLLREKDIFVEFDFAGILRGDRLKEIKALREAISGGLMTPNEARDVLNYPRDGSEQANKLYLPTNNLHPIDEPPPEKGSGRRNAASAAETKEAEHAAA